MHGADLRLFDARSGHSRQVSETESATVTSIAISDDARTGLTGSADGNVRVWRLTPGESTGPGDRSSHAGVIDHDLSFSPHVSAIAISPDAGLVVSGLFSGRSTTVWDLATGRPRNSFDAQVGGIKAIHMVDNSKALIEGPISVAVWDLLIPKMLANYELNWGDDITSVLPGSTAVVTVTRDESTLVVKRRNLLNQHHLPDDLALPTIRLRQDRFHSRLSVDAAARHGVSFGAHPDLYAYGWDLAEGRCLWTITLDWSEAIRDMTVAADGRLWAVAHGNPGYADQRPACTVREMNSGAELWRIEFPGMKIGVLALSSDGSRLATGQDDGVISLWDVAAKSCLGRLTVDHPISVIALSGDGAYLAAGDASGTVHLLRLASQKGGGVIPQA